MSFSKQDTGEVAHTGGPGWNFVPDHAHTHTRYPFSQEAPALSLLGLGASSGSSPGPIGRPASQAASGSETAYFCPRDENGKGGHLARPVSCGVSPTQSPGLGPRPLPIPTGTKGLGLEWTGHCPGAGCGRGTGPFIPCLSGSCDMGPGGAMLLALEVFGIG
jgi:hypothetical protein